MLLDKHDVLYILDVLQEKHGFGYSREKFGDCYPDNKTVGGLQAKLSIMLEAKST